MRASQRERTCGEDAAASREPRACVMNMTSQPPSGAGKMTPPPDTSRARTEPRGAGGPSVSETDCEAMTWMPPGRVSRTVITTRFCVAHASAAVQRGARSPAPRMALGRSRIGRSAQQAHPR